MTTPDYEQRLMQWRRDRDRSLRRENGWLALAGLFWLEQGANRIGSQPGSDVLLPERLPASVGTIRLEGKQAVLHAEPGAGLLVNGEPVNEAALIDDTQESPSFLTLDGIRMVVIDRPSGIGIRMWDNQREERDSHPGRQWFPINEKLILPARFERHPEQRKVLLPDVFGDMVEAEMNGRVHFEIDGQPYTLEASEEENRLEIHFQDPTNKKNSYPSGRYYYSPEPLREELFILDFNYSYSPPCAFTPFATCAFAPAENHLPVPIEAGETYIPNH